MAYSDMDAFDILYFCILHALLNTSFHQTLFYYNPDFDVAFDLFKRFGMMLDGLTGLFLVFILSKP